MLLRFSEYTPHLLPSMRLLLKPSHPRRSFKSRIDRISDCWAFLQDPTCLTCMWIMLIPSFAFCSFSSNLNPACIRAFTWGLHPWLNRSISRSTILGTITLTISWRLCWTNCTVEHDLLICKTAAPNRRGVGSRPIFTLIGRMWDNASGILI